MAAIPFQIEVLDADRRLVIARRLNQQKFRLGPGAALGGVALEAMAIPPSTETETAMRDDLFMFRLARSEEASRLRAGATVELTDWREV